MITLTPAEHAEVLRQSTCKRCGGAGDGYKVVGDRCPDCVKGRIPGPIYLTVEGDRMGSTLPHVKYQGSEYGEGWFVAPSRFVEATGPCETCGGRGELPHVHDRYCAALDCIDPCPSCEGTGRKRAELRAEAEAGNWPQCDYPNGVLFAHATVEVLAVTTPFRDSDIPGNETVVDGQLVIRSFAGLNPTPGRDWIVVLDGLVLA